MCWNCGQRGHGKADCTRPKAVRPEPPTRLMDVSGVLSGRSDRMPFLVYCEAVAAQIDATKVCLLDTGIKNHRIHKDPDGDGDTDVDVKGVDGKSRGPQRNWNAERKSVYIVAAR